MRRININTKKSIALTKNEKAVIKWVMSADFVYAKEENTKLTRGEFAYALKMLIDRGLIDQIENGQLKKRILWMYRVNASRLDEIKKALKAKSRDPRSKYKKLDAVIARSVALNDDDDRCIIWKGNHDRDNRPMYGSAHAGWVVLEKTKPEIVNAVDATRVKMGMSCGNKSCISKNHLVPIMGRSRVGVEQERLEYRDRDITAALSMPWVKLPSELVGCDA